ncbi:hypothetical protein FPANT_2488 [Fusarium pseudoanthophilum]|uniref:Uncharacterized protein n=1 Tax=Fusarium pseudoanthophilum TaxID=48495 RepID=A0A8H5UV34_9HYPO|nr:hypothetical protein FPANT_2488 [Fusarium pseudoanthophilum]
MTPSRTFGAENESGPHSPTDSVSSTVSADSERATRNVGRKSLAQEIEDCLRRENENRNEDAQTAAEVPIEHALLNWFLGRQIEDLPSELTMSEIWEIKKRVYAEKRTRDGRAPPEISAATTLVVMIISSLLILTIGYYY